MPGVEQLFRDVIACEACDLRKCPRLLRDTEENVPQPGFVGRSYGLHRVLLVGQNPAVPPDGLREADKPYTRALRHLRDEPSAANYEALYDVLLDFVPKWPVHGTYFPLEACGLELEDIAYFNLVRCRTVENAAPRAVSVQQCIENHFDKWLGFLSPKVVVFIGVWAFRRGVGSVERRGVPHAQINRNRTLNKKQLQENQQRVARLVREHATKVE